MLSIEVKCVIMIAVVVEEVVVVTECPKLNIGLISMRGGF
jgi:hypothetical protein